MDLAYLLELQRLPVPSAAAVLSPGGDMSSLHVLLRSEVNCSLPAGCLCRATNTLQVRDLTLRLRGTKCGPKGSVLRWEREDR